MCVCVCMYIYIYIFSEINFHRCDYVFFSFNLRKSANAKTYSQTENIIEQLEISVIILGNFYFHDC